MGRYVLKTAKNKYKKEFSCIERWDDESGYVFSIKIIGNNLKDTYISYNVYHDLIQYRESFCSQPFDLLKLLIVIETYDIPKKVAEKFISKVTAIRQKSN